MSKQRFQLNYLNRQLAVCTYYVIKHVLLAQRPGKCILKFVYFYMYFNGKSFFLIFYKLKTLLIGYFTIAIKT